MGRIRKKHWPCGHRGYGQICHRCETADRLEALLKSGKLPATHGPHQKKLAREKTPWSRERTQVEIERLRHVPPRKGVWSSDA
jgi:hypothetical protein